MEGFIPQTATLITKNNASLLAIISGRPKSDLEANIGWVLLRDLDLKYYIIPRSEYKASYSHVELYLTMLDNK